MKERLVGAAVLVAIGVWLIPWVLDGPETPVETGANSLQLPAAEEPVPMRTQTLRLDGPNATSPAEPTEPVDEPVDEAAVVANEARAVSDAEAVAPPVAKLPPAVEPVVESPPPTATRTASAPAPAVSHGDWVVQLGSFGEEANARRLAERASTFGYKAGVSSYKASGRTMYRVRVGAYETRSQAEATASALTAHGLVAQVVPAN